jgi:hypothetical protein
MASKSGYSAKLSVGAGYTGAELTNVSVSINHEPVEVSDLASTWRERAKGLLDWEVTGSKNYATQAFLTIAGSGTTSVAVSIFGPNSATTAVFTGVGYVTRGMTTFPMGAATEEITVVGNGTAPTIRVV